jgi:uncharacterized alpha-E superfamily protein
MLSRVAQSLHWMGRYVERAENTARLLDVNLQLLLDHRDLDDASIASHWQPIVESAGDGELFLSLHPEANARSVVDFLVFDARNPNSIVAAVSRARENARTVRDQLTAEVWEELNRLYLFLESREARERFAVSPTDLFAEVKHTALVLTGLAHETVMHGEGWQFAELGRYIERADQTTRILDVLHAAFPERGMPAGLTERDSVEWAAVLRSCSAWDAYKSVYGANVDPTRVVGLLLLHEEFPRSVRFCAEQLDAGLRQISGVAAGRFANTAEQLSGRFLAELRFATVEDLLAAHGLHGCLDRIQQQLAAIGCAVYDTYVGQPFLDPEPADLFQQQMQQQQQQQQQKQQIVIGAVSA